jgi:diguanylate cyclase (GGDEF)-like protein
MGLPVAVLFIDIDNFKDLNTQHTETVIDKTLLPDTQSLPRDMTTKRGTAYRHGGEEFVVIAPNLQVDEALGFAERLRSGFEVKTYEVGDASESITVSIGVALWPDHGSDYEQVLLAANRAKQTAKDGGRNRVCVSEDIPPSGS